MSHSLEKRNPRNPTQAKSQANGGPDKLSLKINKPFGRTRRAPRQALPAQANYCLTVIASVSEAIQNPYIGSASGSLRRVAPRDDESLRPTCGPCVLRSDIADRCSPASKDGR